MSLPEASWGRGSAAKIAFTGPNDGWLVTYAGWLFHYTDGALPPRDGDPAYSGHDHLSPQRGRGAVRAGRAAGRRLGAVPPAAARDRAARRPQQVQRLRTAAAQGQDVAARPQLVVRFTLMRKARVALIARRKGKTVARTRAKLMRPGRHALRLRLDPRRWPQRLSFSAREPGAAPEGGGDEDTVTTGTATRRPTTPGEPMRRGAPARDRWPRCS